MLGWSAKPVIRFVCLISLSLWACAKEEPQLVKPKTLPNILLISMDTLRADHMGCYGHDIANTPELDKFLQHASLWVNAYSTAPWTLPSHASMFTGQYPYQHGAHTFETKKPGRNESPLGLEATTLAEVLRGFQYETAAFVTNKQYLAKRFQLDQGFQNYTVFAGKEVARAADVNDKAFAWLEQKREQPFFLFLNYMDTHRPYRSEGHPDLFDFPVGTDCGRIQSRLMEPILTADGSDQSEDLKQLAAQYDVSIANLDQGLGALFRQIEKLGLMEDTLIILTSDHGEYFGEHDLLKHSKDVYQEALHVPLIVKMPGQKETRRMEQATTIANIPTLIFDALPKEQSEAAFLAIPRLELDQGIVAENYYSRSRDLFDVPWGDRFHRVRRVFFADGWKYIHSSDGHHELYHLDKDPREFTNLISVELHKVVRMRESLDRHLTQMRDVGSRDDSAYSEEEMTTLDQLGY